MLDDRLALAHGELTAPGGGPGAGWLGTRPRPLVLAGSCAALALVAGGLAPSHLKYALALVALAGLIGAVLLRPLFGAFVLVGLVPITSGLAPGFPMSHVRLAEALIGVVGVTLLVSVRRRDAVRWEAIDWLLVVYAVGWLLFAVLADVAGHQHLSLSQWGTAAGQLQFFLVYRGVRVAVRSEAERRTAVGVLLLASIPVSLLAILQKVNAPGVRSFIFKLVGATTAATATKVVGGHLRATGPFANWAALAGFLLPLLLVLFALALAQTETRWRRWFVTAGVLGLIAIALSEEQSALICLMVGVAVLAKRYGRGRTVLRWAPLVLLLVLVLAGPSILHRINGELSSSAGTGRVWWLPQTVSFRWSVWTKQYFPAIGAHLLNGYGVVLPSTIRWTAPESQYVAFLMEGGVPMLALFGSLAWAMRRGARAAARAAAPFDRALGQAVAIGIVSMLVMSTMWPFLSNGGMPQVLWALLALTVPRPGPKPVATLPFVGEQGLAGGDDRRAGALQPAGSNGKR